MPRYKVVIEAQGPLLLGDGLPADNLRSSRSFVAGSVLRGSLAKAILTPLGLWRNSGRPETKGALPEAFQQVFLAESPARFGFLYPVRTDYKTAEHCETFPIPLTARTCKAHKGFKADKEDGVLDRLMNDLRRKAGWEKVGGRRICPTCNKERLDRMRGFGVREAGPPTISREAKVDPRSFVRVGLNRSTETAEEGILYTLEALVPDKKEDERLFFVGYWTMTEAQWAQFDELLKAHVPKKDNDGYGLRLGSARAQGMGEVVLHLPEGPEPEDDLEARLDRFQPQNEQGDLLDADHTYFALTLRAPLLMYDAFGRLVRKMESEIISAYITPPPGLDPLPEASFIEQETWSGWSAAWGLPKPVTPALAPGSVLAFRVPVAERAALLTFLQTLEIIGLGERRAEGWGEVTPCDLFHVEFDEEASNE